MSSAFKNLKIGDKFHNGKSKGMGTKRDVMYWMEFEKISPSKARCIKQVGYDNNRLVGGIHCFGPNSPVWIITD